MPLATITKVGAFSDDVATQINDNFSALAGAAPAGSLTENKILVGDSNDLAAEVSVSGDATLVAAGTLTVTGVNGAAVAADGTEIDAAVDFVGDLTATATEINTAAAVIDALPTSNVASPAIWNDAGVLKVGTA